MSNTGAESNGKKKIQVCGWPDDQIRVWGDGYWITFKDGIIVGESMDTPPSFHKPTDADRREASQAVAAAFMPPTNSEVFIRFGELPEEGISTNWATGEKEPGCSVYDAYWDYEKGVYHITGNALTGALISYTLRGANVYLVTGVQNGIGSDREPTLSNVRIICELNRTSDGYKPVSDCVSGQ